MRNKPESRPLRQFAIQVWPFLLILYCAASPPQKAEVPVVDANLGSCSANFTVKDGKQKPIYDAKIDVIIRYGFLGIRKVTLQVGTNSDGKARVAGLPDRTKKPLEFEITSGRRSKTIMVDTSDKCNATIDVSLETR